MAFQNAVRLGEHESKKKVRKNDIGEQKRVTKVRNMVSQAVFGVLMGRVSGVGLGGEVRILVS